MTREASTLSLDDDDCDDTRSAVSPSGTETCSTSYDDDRDEDDNDLGVVGASTYYADRDSDGYGDPADSREYCDPSGVYNELMMTTVTTLARR